MTHSVLPQRNLVNCCANLLSHTDSTVHCSRTTLTYPITPSCTTIPVSCSPMLLVYINIVDSQHEVAKQLIIQPYLYVIFVL